MKDRTSFFAAAVAMAKQHGYSGYSSDEELRGNNDPKSWVALRRFAPSYMEFMNDFADALHAEGLSVVHNLI